MESLFWFCFFRLQAKNIKTTASSINPTATASPVKIGNASALEPPDEEFADWEWCVIDFGGGEGECLEEPCGGGGDGGDEDFESWRRGGRGEEEESGGVGGGDASGGGGGESFDGGGEESDGGGGEEPDGGGGEEPDGGGGEESDGGGGGDDEESEVGEGESDEEDIRWVSGKRLVVEWRRRNSRRSSQTTPTWGNREVN